MGGGGLFIKEEGQIFHAACPAACNSLDPNHSFLTDNMAIEENSTNSLFAEIRNQLRSSVAVMLGWEGEAESINRAHLNP